MIKKRTMLLCTAAIAIASFAGRKTLGSRTHESNSYLLQNVEALSRGEVYSMPCNPDPKSVCVYPASCPNGDTVLVRTPLMVKAVD